MLIKRDLLYIGDEPGCNSYFVTDSTELFEENAQIYLGKSVKGFVEKIELEL